MKHHTSHLELTSTIQSLDVHVAKVDAAHIAGSSKVKLRVQEVHVDVGYVTVSQVVGECLVQGIEQLLVCVGYLTSCQSQHLLTPATHIETG